MGRRSRVRERAREGAAGRGRARERMARVRVDDATWAAFRLAYPTEPIAAVLGRLIARDVARHQRTQGDGVQAAQVIKDARQLAAELEGLARRVETQAAS